MKVSYILKVARSPSNAKTESVSPTGSFLEGPRTLQVNGSYGVVTQNNASCADVFCSKRFLLSFFFCLLFRARIHSLSRCRIPTVSIPGVRT